MANTYKNKLVINGVIEFDLTADTVTPSSLMEGVTAHDASGAPIVGTATGSNPPVWQGTDNYVYLSSDANAPVAIYMDEDGYVVLDIEPPALNLQTKSVTPTETSQTVVADTGYDALEQVNVGAISSSYVGSGVTRRGENDLEVWDDVVVVPPGLYENREEKSVGYVNHPNPTVSINSSTGLITASHTSLTGFTDENTKTATLQLTTQAAATITPSTSQQTAVAAGRYTTGAVTVSAMPTGTAGTPTATKGTVSNHSISVTPSVTNTTGYITGSTKTGTAVTVSASELASGNKAITQNGTNIDVVGYSTVSVDVQGGGGSEPHMARASRSGGDSNTAIFTGLLGEPTSFFVIQDDNITPSAQAMISSVVYDGTSIHAQSITNTANAQVSYVSSGISYSYNNGTLTITSTTIQFPECEYLLLYSYAGSSANVDTKDVQVGSGATNITFTGLDDEPIGWSCIFKSNFSTSSGYQRVISVGYGNDGTNIFGVEMDSSAKNALHWTSSYNNGSLTITSQGTNAGGYFHQPGYYQLTYVSAGSGGGGGEINLQSKTVNFTPSTTAQSQTIRADSGYDGLSQVQTNVAAMPTGTAGTPTATKSVVNNHAVTVTPSVTNTTGYITGSTKTGTAVSVSASELVSGNLAITQNGTGINVANYSTVSVNVPTGSSTLITKTITANGTYNASSDSADGYSSVTVNVSGGGGASNFVQGTFTAGTAGTVQTISIPYTGNGYPIALTIAVDGGAYVNGSGNANAQAWYDAIHQYAIGVYTMTKCGPTNTPQYTGSNIFIDGGVALTAYKSSATNNNAYSRGFSNSNLMYTTEDPTTSSPHQLTISSATILKIMISGETSGYGFLSGLTYSYYIVYSS